MFIYAFASCFIAWFPSIVPVGFLLAEVRPPTVRVAIEQKQNAKLATNVYDY
jgi:hypothetical protein